MKRSRFTSHPFRKRSLLVSAAILVLLSFLTSWYYSSTLSVSHQQKLLQHYINVQQADAQTIIDDSALMRKLVLHTETPEEFRQLTSKKYGLFLFVETISDNQDLLFWNNQKIIPPKADFDSTYGVFFQQLLNGYYVIQKSKVELPGMSNNIVAYVLIPVLRKYYLEAENSQTEFAHDKDAIKKINLAELPTPFPIIAADKKVLFHLKQAPLSAQRGTDPVTIVLRLTALVFLLIALHLYAEKVYKRYGSWKGVLFLALALLLVRSLMYIRLLDFSLRKFALFDPTIYASNFFNRSLGDLLINAVLLCWILLFAWSRLGPVKRLPTVLKGKGIVAAGIAGVALLLYATFQLAIVVNNLVVNSKISFEVTDFSRLSSYTGVSFFILALLSLSYYYFSRLLFRFILLAFPNLVYLYFTVAVIGLIFLSFQTSHFVVLFQLPILLWLVIYTLVLTQQQAIINRFRITIAGMLFWIFIFSISLSALIMQGNRQREQAERQSVALKYEQLSEPTKQSVLSIAMTYLNTRFLQNNFQRFTREPANSWLRDSITSSSMADYATVYNTNLYIFDSADKPVNNPDPKSYEELDNIFNAHSRSTNEPGLVYYETSPSQFVYLIKRQATDSTLGRKTLFVVATPKQFQDKEAMYPDIFRRSNNDLINQSYIVAIYQNNRLMRYNGNYAFPVTLDEDRIPAGEFTNYERGDYDELWYKASNHKIIIVAKKKESLIESITLFSYLFCAFLLMVGVIRFFELSARVARSWPRVEIFTNLNIRSQIHGTIIFISILSFLIIGVATISYFEKRSERNNIERISRTSSGTLEEIEKRLNETQLSFSSGAWQDTASTAALKRLITDIADVHRVIINIYDLNGTQQITSDDQFYTKGVLSTKMDPTAYYHMASQQEVQRVQEEKVSDIDYLSIYTAIRNNTNHETVAYLNIPSFSLQQDLNQEISNFLVTIINLNAFIVLIAGVLALFITNRITRSFSVISDKMKEVTLGRTNEEIAWNRSDEIGELVTQYNKMVRQLEDSAAALAKSEREGAWREMARQVAHEIKNPLTPMKLSIQYLQKAIQNNLPNVKDLTTNVANTLIEQIDHLSKIASDFSQFANIGNKRLETIDLHSVIGSLLDLYATNPKVQLHWQPLPGDLLMKADKTHMNRLFTNLLTNAVDACSERELCVVTITEQLVGNEVMVAVKDNGDGIPAEMQSKIFTPNFTTKTSGTGLGLAMCKSIVEGAGGHIWFDTKEGEGTTFYLQLPLLLSQDAVA